MNRLIFRYIEFLGFTYLLEKKQYKMLKIINPLCNFFNRCSTTDSVKRYFLSKAYRCDEAWANRLKNPIFKKVDLGNLYHELDTNLMNNMRINVLDVDILFNSVVDRNYKNEVDDILFRLRLCPESRILPERASHAAIRWYMENNSPEEVFNTLSDRLNYGLFPDCYLTNLLIDKYLQEKDSRSAVKAAVLQMLQEDFNNSILKALALHSCYNYLESPDIWETYKEPPPDPDEEVQKVRVNFIRNPYFDDHFDIKDTNHLVGKTLWMIGCSMDKTIGASSQLVGLVLYEKYEKCTEFLERCIEKGTRFHKEAVAKAREYSLKKPKQMEEENKEEKKVENDDEKKVVNTWKSKVLDLLGKIREENLVKGSLLSDSAELVQKMVQENESKEIEEQCKIYEQWEKDREDHIQSELKKAETLKVMSEVEATKAKLKKEEEKLFFFDKEEELEMIAKEKEKEMEGVFYYKEKKKKTAVREEYIPPDVSQKKF